MSTADASWNFTETLFPFSLWPKHGILNPLWQSHHFLQLEDASRVQWAHDSTAAAACRERADNLPAQKLGATGKSVTIIILRGIKAPSDPEDKETISS